MPMHEQTTEKPMVKYLIGKSVASSGIIAGLIATQIATVFGLWFTGAKLPQFDFNTLNGYLALGTTYGFTHPAENFLIGGIIHYVDGILWGLIFALIIHPMLGQFIKPLAPLTPTNNFIKGIIWGLALWIISSALWMPLLIGPLLDNVGFGGVGPFLTHFSTFVGYQAVFTNLLWHTIWGLNLGLMFNPVWAASTSR
ncbi:MAG TPA: hypothetical protein VIL58_07740 [Thermoplasmata archaeon]